MYLARVEMSGFKSFADKTIIEFDQGMTAVVGPNGSGKSNLTEAIRWVLGEQSAKSLRGNRMEDVIFNGTQDRKPINIAKVSLILNNEDRYLDVDQSEIVITRTYHRNGDSQYYINKEACRLKDIVDLLLDTGLGKNSFSIISQGQVEQVFLNKPEERRTIFEEAAGVQKYQYRKNEAERKLFRSKDHLSRVKDIIHELNLQLTPLERQKEDALKYQSLKASLKEKEISLFTHQIRKSKQAWQDNEAKLHKQQDEKNYLEQEDQSAENTLLNLKEEYQTIINEIDRLSQDHQTTLQSIERNHGEVKMIKQQIEYQQSNHQEKEQSFQKNSEILTKINEAIQDTHQQLERNQSEYDRLQAQVSVIEGKRQSLSDLNEIQVEVLRSDMIHLYQEKATLNNRIQHSQSEIEKAKHKLQQLRTRIEENHQIQNQLSQELSTIENQISSHDNHIQTMDNQLQVILEDYQKNQQKREQLKKELFDVERQCNQSQYRLDSLKQNQEEYVGYYAGVRMVMKHKARLKGIHQPLADIIQVDSKFEQALEIALGGAAQHIIVDNDQSAKAAIQLLKNEKAGRATFLPMTNIKGRYLNDTLLNQVKIMPGFIGIAKDIVSFDNIYQEIVANILGSTIIVETIEQAQAMAQQTRHRVKLVTLDGDLLLPGGSITGGKQKNHQQSMISRKNQMEQYQYEHAQLKQQLETIESAYQFAEKQHQILEADLRQQRQTLTESQSAHVDISKEIEQKKHALKQVTTEISVDQHDLHQFEEDNRERASLIESMTKELNQVEQRMVEIEQELNQASLSEEDRRQQIQAFDQEYHQLKTQTAVINVEIQQLKHQKKEHEMRYDELQTQIQEYQMQKATSHQGLTELEASMATLQESLQKEEKAAERIKDDLDSKRQYRQNIHSDMQALEKKQHTFGKQLQKHYQTIAKLEAQIEKNQSIIDNYLTYLNQEYQLSFEMAEKVALEIDSEQKVQDVVRTLKRQIENLGPINLQAIEDFEELNTRYQNLVAQENDLLTAMSQLQETMDEMDSEVISRFGVTFKRINEQFQTAFQKLFGGGQALLELTNPQDLLTTGIDIIAQPPGKKKQNLALLSGGERALTAIALLFAILEIKAVPFVVLDEVEAALDDANVYRYGEYIQSFTEQTQFIVITHRKGTMEHADVLYGVTMQQSGVSKMVSVKLSEAREEKALD